MVQTQVGQRLQVKFRSVLGPLLIMLFINDMMIMSDDTTSSVKILAGDTKAFKMCKQNLR